MIILRMRMRRKRRRRMAIFDNVDIHKIEFKHQIDSLRMFTDVSMGSHQKPFSVSVFCPNEGWGGGGEGRSDPIPAF